MTDLISKYTDGPWMLDGPDEFGDYNVVSPEGPSAVAAVVSNLRDPEQVAANARLVAASPEMAVEIRKQITWLRHLRSEAAGKLSGFLLSGIDQSIKYLSAVLDKAEGRSDG